MKKTLLFAVLLFGSLCLSGCGSANEKSILKDLEKKLDNTNAYQVEGDLNIYRSKYVDGRFFSYLMNHNILLHFLVVNQHQYLHNYILFFL